MAEVIRASEEHGNRTRDAGGAMWRICIDTGGTFTDCVARDPSGARRRAKALSSGAVRVRLGPSARDGWLTLVGVPEELDLTGWMLAPADGDGQGVTIAAFDAVTKSARSTGAGAQEWRPGRLLEASTGEPAPIVAARMVTGAPLGSPLPPMAMRLATTRGTNALLQGAVARVALFVTEGFGDLLEIDDQRRPDLFALDIRKRRPWHERVVEVPGRLTADGSELRPLELDRVRSAAKAMLGEGVNCAAVALAHAWINPDHERAVEALLLELGFAHVSRSSALSPMIGMLTRARTSVVNAALAGVIDGYIASIRAALSPDSTLEVMTSAGGMADAGDFRPKDSLLSGPAAGVAGAVAAGLASGCQPVIAFDMGGTSTDVSRSDARVGFEYVFRHEVGGAEILAPALAIESVAAGGGSICDVVDGVLSVGPQSAGASPGPACYGAGGPLTITDVNLLLGRIDPARFATPIDVTAARRAFNAVCARAGIGPGEEARRDGLLQGFLDLANERMAGAIGRVSARKGYDPSECALVAFGGAGGQHACAVAERLGITRIISPPEASLLSAVGLEVAARDQIVERQTLRLLADIEPELGNLFDAMVGAAVQRTTRERETAPDDLTIRRIAHVRFAGQEFAHAIDWAPGLDLLQAFRDRCAQVFGHALENRAVEVESLRVVLRDRGAADQRAAPIEKAERARAASGARARFGGEWIDADVFERTNLQPGDFVDGPALVVEDQTIVAVERGWEAMIDSSGALSMTHRELRREGRLAKPAMVKLELAASRLISIAQEMGETLRRTAISTNVKERLDYSCAILDPKGRLVVSAPHIPVHLGALGLCVRRLVAARGELAPQSAIVTNHPAFGGSHLPDVTVVAPAHDEHGRLLGYVACRAHHAEIGGSRPGSMPPDARSLEEEGAIILPMTIMSEGRAQWANVHKALTEARYPTRAIEDNLADLAAQIASCRRSTGSLRDAAAEMGAEVLVGAMESLLRRADSGMTTALAALGETFEGTATEPIEDAVRSNSAIRVRVEVRAGHTTVDFTGTSGTHPGNLNAPAAVTQSAVIYVLRLLLGDAGAGLPLNEGLMARVSVVAPPGLLNPAFDVDPGRSPAVAAGNVETSQRIVNALVRAFGLAADSQGTMNNVLFGAAGFGFYETICGGAGAGPGFAGASAVHTHMTNTAITDAEIIERRYPVRMERFAVRAESGGSGRWRGGDGAVREFVFLEPVALSVISQSRTNGPRGGAGGGAGSTGSQWLIRASGRKEPLGAIDGRDVGAGDRLIIQTPGGGGWGIA
jgi:5-oxoprolinase (ATP-hydrolysing)